jgi:Cys-tRNA synthase (O-phospho-L-seryl-tRNA:Cys-tRNA synthase)
MTEGIADKMNVTIVVPTMEGRLDDDVKPIVLPGHLNQEEARKIALDFGSGYPHCSIVSVPDGHLANFSNDVNPPLENGLVSEEVQGHLVLQFYHSSLPI